MDHITAFVIMLTEVNTGNFMFNHMNSTLQQWKNKQGKRGENRDYPPSHSTY